MAINIKFDLMGNPEPPSIVLANRNGNKLGQLNVNVDSIDVDDKFNSASEFSFTLNKYIDEEPTPLWDKVVDFKLVNCPEWDMWFEIKVELDEATETVKTVFCTQLGQAELSQIMLYNIEINTDVDIEREDYKTSILYDENNQDASILHRLLEKAPHYSIAYVDESIQRIQRQFSFDGTSICDAFNEIAEEIGCLFVYNSNSQAGGKPNRTISVYDLQQNCNNKDCKHRGEFTDKCPKCGSTDITYGYGEDTTIFVTSDELATEGIQLVTDTDSVKNCFKLEAGDDLMTATIRNCNPNGTDYIWYFSDSIKEDMSEELVDGIEGYDELYKDYYNNHISELDRTLVNQYNALVAKYDDYYNTKSTCLDCKTEGDFEEKCSNCNSKNILVGQKLQTIPTTITGYPALMTAYYNTIDLLLYLESGLMPNVEMSDTSAEDQIKLLTTTSLSPIAVNVEKIKNASLATANSTVLSMAKVLIRPTYKVDIVDGSASLNSSVNSDVNGEYRVWTGKFIATNYSDEEDTATSDVISVRINNATETFIKQKIEKALNKEDTDDYSITGLFAKEYDEFCDELKKYALNPLKSFYEACDVCLGILTEQGAGNEDENPDLYEKLYKPYFDKQQAINAEMETRENEIAIIEGVWNKTDESNPMCATKGLQQYIEDCQKEIQDALDFENYLGEDLWLEFCAYRREDKYSNSNYISDGLNNAELFAKANEFIEVAEEEIFKSAELQHSVSATLNNLLSLPKFEPLLNSFKTGNWIRVQVDDKVYKLRLLEYNFGYGDTKNISVEFSDVTKIKNGVTDVQEVFEQASSMASSYDSVQRQAKKGNVARSTIDQWIVDGLDSADVQIKSNNNEEITLTKNGLLARSYDDITGTYSPEQFKLTHNIMAYTDDNWETVSSALGKHKYNKWNGTAFVNDEGYGLTSKFLTAGYVTGSQMIGGAIISSNYSPKQSGTYINLLNGDFDFAGGKIVYDASDNKVKLKGVTIQWTGDDGVNTPEVKVEDVTGLDEYLGQLGDLEEQLDGRIQTYSQSEDPSKSWTDDAEKLNHIGDLWINPSNGITKRWDGTQWIVVTDSDLKKLAESKAQIFTSIPTPPYYVGDLWVQGSSGEIMRCITERITGDYAASEWDKASKYTDDSALDNFKSNEFNPAKTLIENVKTISDNLIDGLGFQETEITGQYVISPVIAGGTLLIGDQSGTHAQITTEGKLICSGAQISGNITATSLTLGDGVKISTDDIDGLDEYAKISDIDGVPDNIITADDVLISSTTSANGVTTQSITVGDNTYTSIISGDFIFTDIGLGTNTEDGSKRYTCISKDGLLTAKNAIIYGTVYASAGRFAGDIVANSLTLGNDYKIPTTDISGLSAVATSGSYNDLSNTPFIPTSVADLGFDTSAIVYKGDVTQTEKTDSNGVAYVETTVPSASGTITYSTYDAEDYMVFGRSKGMDSDGSNYICVSKEGLLTARNALIYGTIYATDGEFNGTIIANSGSFIQGGKIGAWTLQDQKLGGETMPALTSGMFQDVNGYDSQVFLTPKGIYTYIEGYATDVTNVIYSKPWREVTMAPEITVHNIKGGRRLLLQNPQDKFLCKQIYFDFMDKVPVDNKLGAPRFITKLETSDITVQVDIMGIFIPGFNAEEYYGNIPYKDDELRIVAAADYDTYPSETYKIYYEIYDDGKLINTIERNDIDFYVLNANKEQEVKYKATQCVFAELEDSSNPGTYPLIEPGEHHITVRTKSVNSEGVENLISSDDSETRVYIVPKTEATISTEE